LDDDCDGVVDEGVAIWYLDSDGDGWGQGPATASCSIPPGYSSRQGDCDDANPAVHPGASEIQCNGGDEDCDGIDGTGPDADDDGFSSVCDNCPSTTNPAQRDADGDDVGDVCDNCALAANPSQSNVDDDVPGDACDNCPLVYNHQDDFDHDAVGDACDNCPYDPNAAQTDFDADLEGDLCDVDDGLILLFRTEPAWVEWRLETTYEEFNVYQGDLAVLRDTGSYTQLPGSNASAQRTCGVVEPYSADPGAPPSGSVQFTLVTGVAAGVEGSLGQDGAGVERANSAPCSP
jgi:hypothetical protein